MKIAQAKTIIHNLLDKHQGEVILIVAGTLGTEELADALALTDNELTDLVTNNRELRDTLVDRIIERAAL